MVMVMEAALKTEDQVVSPTGMGTADPEAPAPWTGQEQRLVQAFSLAMAGLLLMVVRC